MSNSKNSLQLACKESHEVVEEHYTFVFQAMTTGPAAQYLENISKLYLLPFNPDKDIGNAYLCLEERDTWEDEICGLTPVKHLSLDGEYSYDIDAVEHLEAACPNLEILTIRIEGNDFFRELIEFNPRVDFEPTEIDSSFFDNLAATISNGKGCPTRKAQRYGELRDKYNKYTKLFECLRERHSEYWKRVNMTVVLSQKPA